MTRKSKIARLPRSVRDELNHRLDNGQPGIRLVEWLNSLVEVKETLAKEFQGHRITPQNLSEWKRGGYRDWLAQQEQMTNLKDWLADAKELGETASPEKLTQAILNVVTVRYAAAMDDCWIDTPENRKNLEFWGRIVRDFSHLHQCDIACQRLELGEQKMDLDRQRLELDLQRLELTRQKTEVALRILEQHTHPSQRAISMEDCATANPDGVPSISPGLRRDAGRYPGKPSPEIFPNPERVASREAQNLNTNEVDSSSARTRNTEQTQSPSSLENPAKAPLEINDLQPNPIKSNNNFFIFFQPATIGQASRLSPSTLTLTSGKILPKHSAASPPTPASPPLQDKLPADANSGKLQLIAN